MKKIDLVILNMGNFYDWDRGVVNRNFFVLQKLAEDERINKILAVDFLPLKTKQTATHYYKNIIVQPKNHDIIYGDLLNVCYQKKNNLFVYSTIESFFSFRSVAKKIKKLTDKLAMSDPVFWSYNPMFLDFLDFFPNNKLVFDAVDNWLEHPVYPKIFPKPKLRHNYEKLAKRADLIFTVSESLVSFFEGLGRTQNIFWRSNGVDFDHFNDPQKISISTELDNEQRPIIGYLGTIENRVDLSLLRKIAKKNKNCLLVVAGPVWQDVQREFAQKIQTLPNVYTPGRVPFTKSSAILNKFSVCLIPHKSSAFVDSMNPMKLYDYLACGKPIVSTPGAGIEQFSNFIYLAKNESEFLEKIELALKENNSQLVEQRKILAQNYSWKTIVDEMITILNKKIL